MYERLKSRIAALLARPMPLKPQTQRQLVDRVEPGEMRAFLASAPDTLEEHELEILFGPLFTPTLDDRAELAEILEQYRPDTPELEQLPADLVRELDAVAVQLPDGSFAKLKLHEVMTERYVRLLRLEHAPGPAVTRSLRLALPAGLVPVAVALLCEPGMTPQHQELFAALAGHMAERHDVSRGHLETVARFLARCTALDTESMLADAEALLRATEGSAAYAAGGHAYWSPDVAQHHHYRGQGTVDRERVRQSREELVHVTTLVEDLRTFIGGGRN